MSNQRSIKDGPWLWVNKSVFDKNLTAKALLVYMVLAKHADNDTQRAWPSIDKIAELARIDRETAIDGIRTLERAQLIEVFRLAGRGNKYRLLKV